MKLCDARDNDALAAFRATCHVHRGFYLEIHEHCVRLGIDSPTGDTVVMSRSAWDALVRWYDTDQPLLPEL